MNSKLLNVLAEIPPEANSLGDEWLSAATIAKGIQTNEKTVRRAFWRGELEGYKVGKNLLRFRKSDVIRWLESGRTRRVLP